MTQDDRIGPPGHRGRVVAEVDSRLRSVFLQNRLIAGLPRLPGVPLPIVKFVVGQIVDRLLAVPGGMEPLMVLERDPARLAASTGVAVLTVVVARAAGWPGRALADLGAAALLADLGSLLAEEEPGTAGCRWLLDRGVDDFWLRCALVARHARTPAGDAQALHACGGLVFVRLAIAIHDAMQGSGWTDGWRAVLATGDAGQWPDGLLGVSAAAFAGA